MILKIGNKGSFTLIEILSAIVVLTVGFVFVYESFFVCLDLFHYYVDYLNLGLLLEEKLWEIKAVLFNNPASFVLDKDGEFMVDNKVFNWELNYELIDKQTGLYQIDLKLEGKEGRRKFKILRTDFVFSQHL